VPSWPPSVGATPLRGSAKAEEHRTNNIGSGINHGVKSVLAERIRRMKTIIAVGLMAAFLLSATGIAFAQKEDRRPTGRPVMTDPETAALLQKIEVVATTYPEIFYVLMDFYQESVKSGDLKEKVDQRLNLERKRGSNIHRYDKIAYLQVLALVSPEAKKTLAAKCTELVKVVEEKMAAQLKKEGKVDINKATLQELKSAGLQEYYAAGLIQLRPYANTNDLWQRSGLKRDGFNIMVNKAGGYTDDLRSMSPKE
jgi:DNA uptake protein ComE-like DNA-binding protein